jgi:hypothetical protein
MTLYEALRARFNEKLSSTFDDLYQGGPPLNQAKPYAVFDIGEDGHTSFCFALECYTGKFTISVVHETQEDCDAAANLVVAAFRDCENEWVVDDLTISMLQWQNSMQTKVEDAFWMATLDYKVEYEKPR